MGNNETPATQPGTSITFKPVEKTNWVDFETFFQSRLSYCWCMAWRMTTEELKHNTASDRKEFIKARIYSGVPVGLLGYVDDRPVCWCSVAPRETYRRLGGDESLENVWSIACFYIQKEYRNQRMVKLLIENAKKYAKEKWREVSGSLPGGPGFTELSFHGFYQHIPKNGLHFCKKSRNEKACDVAQVMRTEGNDEVWDPVFLDGRFP